MFSGYKNGKKVGIVFSGGPASAANTVISSSVLSFINHNIAVIGFYSGFEYLEKFEKYNPLSLLDNIHYIHFDTSVTKIRNIRGVFLRTSRANPGKEIHGPDDLKDPKKNRNLQNILDAFEHLGVGALVTIGGDDTLKVANYLNLMGLPVIHVPKTIDNDYFGIPWTFGYWTAVEITKNAILNLKADAESTDSYFVVELMGRKSGWLTYAAGIAGEAVKMIASEDIEGEFDVEGIAEECVDLIILREREAKTSGVICVAEGLVDKLPEQYKPHEVDKHGNVIFGRAEIAQTLAEKVKQIYKKKTGKSKKVNYKQIGYETRSAPPVSFDVVLGSMLGFGTYSLFKNGQFGHMVSVTDNFDIKAIPFTDLVEPETLVTRLRNVPKGSDFYNLKEALSYRPLE
jgi:ATP-dependent phosphofructokinase / diphosphate-dependent phosphofructokinase